jgi:pyruvate kinase
MRRTKIVCTLGPASSDPEVLDRLVAAGLDCARLNFSHGTHESHRELAKSVRSAAQRAGRPLAILADLCGPKMRVGTFSGGPIELRPGAHFTLTTQKVDGNQERVHVTYESLPLDVSIGERILLDDGLISLRVESKTETEVVTRVEEGGTLSDRKGLNLPGTKISTPALTAKDRSDLDFAVNDLAVDYVALSFVRGAEDVREAQSLSKGTPVIAKIEKPEAVDHLDAIVEQAEGVMVARGDLGVELGAEKVPLVQKRIIHTANLSGKIVITATQMLDSMMRNPRPTRAEAADVANAVMDGTDAVMLSGETAAGKYPVESVRMMDAIVREVEAESVEGLSRQIRDVKIIANEDWRAIGATARAAAVLATHLQMRAIVSFTNDGLSSRLLAEHRPRVPVVAITRHPQVASQLALIWGVIPRVEVPPESLEEIRRTAAAILTRERLCRAGDTYALLFPWPLSGRTNTLSLHTL